MTRPRQEFCRRGHDLDKTRRYAANGMSDGCRECNRITASLRPSVTAKASPECATRTCVCGHKGSAHSDRMECWAGSPECGCERFTPKKWPGYEVKTCRCGHLKGDHDALESFGRRGDGECIHDDAGGEMDCECVAFVPRESARKSA